jgi:hypothetical protein
VYGTPSKRHGTDKGLIAGHAYTLDHCLQVQGNKLCCLLDPWKHKSRKGAWFDESTVWTDRMKVRSLDICKLCGFN